MKIYILRHAAAEARGPGVREAARRLTAAGKLELRAVLKQARAAGVRPDAILASPWTRALDTGRLASKALKCNRVIQTRALLPDAAPVQTLREIRAVPKARAVLVAGHEPQLTRLAGFLLEAPLSIDFKKSALVRIDVEANAGPPRGVLKWMLTPRLAGGKER